MVVQKSDFIFKVVKKNKDWLRNILMILYAQEMNRYIPKTTVELQYCFSLFVTSKYVYVHCPHV